MTRFLCLLALLCTSAAAHAQAPRDVLLNICNDTRFTVASAAAYRTSPQSGQTLRAWFLVQPGECLNGALNGVAGETLDLHVMSGSFRWPAADGDSAFCVPAAGGLQFASFPPCGGGQEARDFRTQRIERSNRRGSGGRYLGRVSWRISCSDLNAQDAALCLQAPRDERGLAQLARTLEVCNTGGRSVEVLALIPRPDNTYETGEPHALPAGTCAPIYRGFPPDNQVFAAATLTQRRNGFEPLCWFTDGNAVINSADGSCPENARPLAAQLAAYGPFTDSYTVYFEAY